MTDLIDRGDVERVLTDARFEVPEADAATTRPMGRFRAASSRFTNRAAHDRRRRRLAELIGDLDAATIAASAASCTRALLQVQPGIDVADVARHVPVACLARALGFTAPDDMPRLVAAVAASYASGAESDAADAAIGHLLAAAPRSHGIAVGGAATEAAGLPGAGLDEDAALHVQVLVQAFAATAALVEGSMRSSGAAVASTATAELLAVTLRDDPPVPLTRRVAPTGETLTLRLDGPDRDADDAHPRRTLAFGAGARACPAQDLALAMAAAIVEELRAC
jgi:hypothetical protein